MKFKITVFAIIVFMVISLIPLSVKAVPYEAWNNYKILNFNEGFEGLQVNFNVTYGHGDNGLSFNCQEDFEDLRFFNYENDILLYAYNETTINKDYCEIWLKLGTSKNVTMRYNNPEANAYWDLENTFNDVIENIVLALPIDEDEGATVYDYSGYGNNGTIYGASWVDGKYGKALSFDGSDDEVAIPYTTNLDLATFTAVIQIKPDNQTGVYQAMIGCRDVGNTFGFAIRNYVGYSIITIDIGDGTSWLLNSNWNIGVLNFDVYTHITIAVASGGTATLYVNGVVQTTKNFTGVPQLVKPTGNVRLGQTGVGGEWYKGIIDEVRIYNQSNSEIEIENSYNFYDDSTIVEGSVCCRVWVGEMPNIIFGVEYSNLMNDAILIGILALVIALCALLLIVIKKK